MDLTRQSIRGRIFGGGLSSETYLMHFGSAIDIRISLLLAPLGAFSPPRDDFFGGAFRHAIHPRGTLRHRCPSIGVRITASLVL